MPTATAASLLLVHGEERFLVDDAVRAWRAARRSTQLDVEVFDSPQRLDELRRSLGEVPLLDPERSILIRDPPQLAGTGKRGADPPEMLARLLAERAPTTSVCLVAHAQVAPKNPVLAAVRALGGTIAYFAVPKRRELRTWIDREVQRRKLRLGPGAADHIVQMVGNDLGAISSELDKLAAFAAGRALSLNDVVAAVAGDEPPEMWNVLEQLLSGNPGRGAATLDQLLAEGRSSQYLLAILAGQVRDLILAQAYIHVRGSAAGLASELRMPEWRAERLARQARLVSPPVIATWLRALHDVDRRVKAGEVADIDALRIVGMRAADQVRAGSGAKP